MNSRNDFRASLDLVAQLQPALHDAQHAPYPDAIDHTRFRAYMKTSHDVGGEPDIPIRYELKQEEQWELNTYVTCECLGWRGIWVSEERRRMQNVDLGRTVYLGFPYYGRWLLAAARVLVEKKHVTLGELLERFDEVKKMKYSELSKRKIKEAGKANMEKVKRNHHITAAPGIGDPQCFTGKAKKPKFKQGDKVRIKSFPSLFYTRTQEYIRGAEGIIEKVSYESLAPEDEAWDRHDQKPEWFYIVRFNMNELWGDTSPYTKDSVQTEVSERWIEAA